MASRKGSLSLGPRPIKGPGTAGMAPVSVAYAEALQVVSDERMRQACRLLLAEPKGEGDKAGPADVDKLLAYYKECEKAVSVIRKESPSDVFMPPPSVPLAGPLSRSGTAGAARPHAKPLKGVTMIRGRMMGRMHPPGTGASSDRRGLGQKQDSDTSLGNGNSGGAKKLLQTEELIPPPQARQFLAKLNKDDSARTAKTTKAKSASSTPAPPPPSRTTKKSSQAKKEPTSKKSKAIEEEEEEENEEDEEEEEEPSRQSQSRRKRSASTSSPPEDADSSESASSAPTGRRVQPRRGSKR
jgi:hypothetical protein